MFKDQDKDKDLSSKDKDKDFSSKDKDKDKDCIVKDKDQDKGCILVLKESLRTRTRTRTNITARTQIALVDHASSVRVHALKDPKVRDRPQLETDGAQPVR